MTELNKLRNEYTQMPKHYLEKLAKENYHIESDTIKESDTKSLIQLMIAIEFENYYK